MSIEQPVVYRNRVSEFNKLDNSLGEIVVIEALSGYGKTAFLREIVRRCQAQNWGAHYIPLTRGMRPLDILTTTVRELSGNANLTPQGIDDALAPLSYFLSHGKCLAVLFDDVHSLQTETLTWVQVEFAPKLKEELFSITQGNCLIVFSGQNIPVSPASWIAHRRIYLLPFDRNTIQQFVDAVPSPQLQEFLKSARHKKWLIEKMIHLCGGHPRTLLQILQEIETGAWYPHPNRSRESDRTIFERYIDTEINRLIEPLNNSYRQLLESLSIFRSINSSIVKLVQDDDRIQTQYNPLTVIRHLRVNNLLLPRKSVLDPVIRNGLTTRMILNDRERYLALNQLAQRSYLHWLLRFDEDRPFEDAQNCAVEVIYHCLCHSNQLQDLQACLKVVTQHLARLLEAQSAQDLNSIQILTEQLAYDEDISTMLSDYGWSIEQVLREMDQPESQNMQPQRVVSPSSSLSYNYTSGIVAILAPDQGVAGTGFLLWHQAQWLVVTCTHILHKLGVSLHSRVQLSHFSPDVDEFEAEVIQFNPPQAPSNQWRASDDVSILRPVQPRFGQMVKPYPLYNGHPDEAACPSGQQSVCFGYAQDRINRGDYVSGLTFANEVASGFIALNNSSTRGVRPGVSGAPWANTETQTIIGMVQSISANGDQVYLIPSSIIWRIISDVLS